MPGINRRLDHFDYQQTIDVQYPLELEQIDIIESVAQGSENKMKMKIQNNGNKTFGGTQALARTAKVKISIPSQTDSLPTQSGIRGSAVTRPAVQISAKSSIKLVQIFRISY